MKKALQKPRLGYSANQESKFDPLGKSRKGDWDFRISDLVKNPDGTDI